MTTTSAPRDTSESAPSILGPTDTFVHRHVAPDEDDIASMLKSIGLSSLDELVDATVPSSIRLRRPLEITDGAGRRIEHRGEFELLEELRVVADQNVVARSYIGMGYHDCITPPVILRNILENPGWYTQYTPYQAEISQGRLEALLNFQTMVSDLTALPLAGASLLDEGTAAAEAMAMCFASSGGHEGGIPRFLVDHRCHPQTIGVVRTRGRSMGIEVVVGDAGAEAYAKGSWCGVLVQSPDTDGRVMDWRAAIDRAHAAGALVVMATDLLALTLLAPPGEVGADVAVGSAQRFGVPMGFGGPHAAFIAAKPEFARKMPGRIIGVSRDALGDPAYRMAIQTREQHIKREKATSNICTAQALLAIMAGMYAVYHGPGGLRRIARRVHAHARLLARELAALGHQVLHDAFFDTLRVRLSAMAQGDALARLGAASINVRAFDDGTIGIGVDETTTVADLAALLACLAKGPVPSPQDLSRRADAALAPGLAPFERRGGYLTHPVFNTYHAEHEMLRYIFTLQGRDLSLAQSMISLGSCTMKLNATTEMIPVTWAGFGRLHPFAPPEQARGYHALFADLERWLAEITGFAAVALQPNAGSQGEYAGLLVVRAFHEATGQGHRTVCLIPESAHGTNPASAVIAGMEVVVVANKPDGSIDLEDLKARIAEHGPRLACLMVTYPSTYGVFDENIKDICKAVHEAGGQVYMDGANMNAQVGLTSPGEIGADVCHLNLHKTFCIPHGGGGPGMGPIGVAKHLAPYLPGHPVVSPWTGRAHGAPAKDAGGKATGAVAAAPFGSASILPISWVYIALMGASGLRRATQVAILNANYMAARLEAHFPMLFKGREGRVAHEFIIDCRQFEKSAGVKSEDIAKRLMDYGFHAPTMSFPVPGTLMIEPTESESKAELDRFCDALIAIRAEIAQVESGAMDRADNPLKNAPHSMKSVCADAWKHPYSREKAAFPAPWVRAHKFWPFVARVDNPFGDRNLVCVCPPIADYAR